ncbi:MAG: DUF1444 family protein [Planctomycetes bacterium]|nr:DUF1444 family protein [Planctomycetota bacterium]
MPREPEAFAESVASLLKRMQPEYAVDLVGPRELLVNGRRLDLENLYRMVNHEPARGTEIVEHYLEQLFTGDGVQLMSMSLDFARSRIMPRIQPETIFEHLSREQVAHVPFVNDTVVVFVTDLPHMTVSITTEQQLRWNLTIDEMEEIARTNLNDYAPELEVQLVESKEGGKAAIISQHDGYDAARLLLGGLYERLAPQLGGDFYVATPARDMFVALSPRPNPFISRLRDRVMQDFRRLPYPISPDFFLVTRDGVAGTKEYPQEHREAA